MKSLLCFFILFAHAMLASARVEPDTIIIQVGEREQIKISSNSEDELKTLSRLNMNKIIADIKKQVRQSPGKNMVIHMEDSLGSRYLINGSPVDVDSLTLAEQLELLAKSAGAVGDTLEKIFNREKPEPKKRKPKRTEHNFLIDFGLNNYLSDGKFPDESNSLYTVKPIYSWYVALGGVNKTHVAGPLYVDWGANVSWYNFKFENTRTRIIKTDTGLDIYEDTRVNDPIKSKLVAPYVNVSLVPLLHFGKKSRNGFMEYDNDGFRIGLGGYAGYRLGGRTKAVYREDGDRVRDKNRDNFYLNNWRYGVRAQLGIFGVDVYANYDLNELFIPAKGPQLNAFSFGITF